MARILLDRSRAREADEILKRMPAIQRDESDLLEAAILRKKSGDFQGAHHLLAEAFALNPNNVRTIHEMARTKSRLARELKQSQARGRLNPQDQALRRKLFQESEDLLRRAIQLADDSTRLAWCWHDLAWTLINLGQPDNEIEQAFLEARTFAPQEHRIQSAYESWKSRRGRSGRGRPGRGNA
jgi:tetratricopeptide (TPR) repeat protein